MKSYCTSYEKVPYQREYFPPSLDIVYFVRTGSYLPREKKFFTCRCQADAYVEKVIDEASEDLNEIEILSSIQIIAINANKLSDYKRYFQESDWQPRFEYEDDEIYI